MLGRCSALFASLVHLKGLLISTTFQTEVITSFSYVIGLKHVVMLTGLYYPLHKKIPRMNFFILNIQKEENNRPSSRNFSALEYFQILTLPCKFYFILISHNTL